jgi:alpha-D-ribose 1-methylphosphonate 5-triphosphate synthase subunit PhnH
MLSIETGFSQKEHHAQHCFRQVLKALSEPGVKVCLDKHPGFKPLNPAASQIIMSLCDQHTGVYLSSELSDSPQTGRAHAWHNLAFHNGIVSCPIEQADFAVVNSHEAIDFNRLKAGTDSNPELSITLVIQTTDLTRGPRFRLTGPGVKTPREIYLGELSDNITNYLVHPCHSYPLGIDLMFCHQHSLIAISRTTQLELIECM